MLIDRAAGLIWLAVLVLVCLPWSFELIHSPVGRTALVLIGIGGAVAPLALLALSQLRHTRLGRWKPTAHLTDIARIAWRVLTSSRSGPIIAAISISVQLLSVLVLWCCARSIGSPFTLLNSLLLIPPVVLIAAIPISIAGWGVRESVMLAAFAYAGLPNSDGVLVSILFGAGGLVIGALGGAAWVISANRLQVAGLREANKHVRNV